MGLPTLTYMQTIAAGLGIVALVAVLGFPIRYIIFRMIKNGDEHQKLAQRTTEL